MNKPVLSIIFLTAIISLGLQGKFFQNITGAGSDDLNKAMQAAVVISATPSGSLPEIQAGYCDPGQTTVTFTNQGMGNDPALSVVTNLVLGIGLSNNYLLQDGGFTITGMRIAGVDLNTFQALNALDGSTQFTTDPDGAGGLTDADGDGFFDDLPLNATVEVSVFYEVNCSLADVFDLGTNCLNDFFTEMNARMDYEEPGGVAQSFTLPQFLRPANRNFGVENCADPDAFAGLDTFLITHRQHRSLRDFKPICNNGDQFILQIVMPAGVQPVTGLNYLSKNGDIFLPLQSSQVLGDTLILMFDASQSLFLSGDYELQLAFTADCTVALGPSVFPLSFQHYCPACDCRHIWYCNDLEGPQMHKTDPPCPPASLLTCDEGVQTLGFEANRTTFGFDDLNFTVPFDPAFANKKVALGCDSIEMKVLGIVGSASLTDSVGVVILYDNINGSSSATETFLFHEGVVRFTHNGSEFSCPVTSDALAVVSNGTQKTLTFDLNDCLTGLGLTLDSGDTLDFTGYFYVNPDGPFEDEFKKITGFRAYTFARVNGAEASCDHFGQTFTLAKSQVVFDFPNTTEGFPNGCEEGESSWRLFVADNEFSKYFGNELRPAAKVDSIVFDFDPGLLAAFDATEVSVSIPNHPVFGAAYFSIPPLSDFPDGHYVAVFDTLSRVPALNLVEEYIFDLKLKLHPACAAATSGLTGNNAYQIASKINYTDRYYAGFIGDGSCAEPVEDQAQSTIVYEDPPAFSLTPLTPLNDTVANDLVSWDVQFCNTSANADADLTWLALEDPSGTLTVTSFDNISDPANPVALAIETFSTGAFAYTPALLRNDGVNSPDEYCTTIRITASVNDCGDVTATLRTGWNCGPYAVANWNPTLYPPCEEESLNLSIINTTLAPVQVDFQQITSFCAGGGSEEITVSGALSSGGNLPQDDYLLRFIWDENGDGAVQPAETELAQLPVSGAVSPGNPLVFNHLLQIMPSQACSVLVQLEANQTDLCGTVVVALPLPQLLNAGTDQLFCSIDAPALSLNLGVANCDGAAGYQFTWTALAPASVADIDDATSANPILAFDPTGLLGQTLTYILETERLGCLLSTFDTVQVELPAYSNGFSAQDSVILQAADCQATAELCLNIISDNLPDFVFFDNGNAWNDTPVTCNDTLIALGLTAGNHLVIITDTVNGCSDTVFAAVTCTMKDTVYLELVVNASDTVCFSANELSGSIVSLVNDCPDENFASYQVSDDSCLVVTGELVGQEIACMIACDAAGFCDSTIVITTVSHPLPNGIKDTIIATQQGQYCFDEQLLNLTGSFVSIENICAGQSGQFVDFEIDAANYCINYTGLVIGLDTACVRLCDNQGNCDTLSVCVTVIPGNVMTDTVFIDLDTNTFCADVSLLPGDIVSVEDICPENNGSEVVFFVDGDCISYYGTAIGTDTACIRMEDEFGNVALTQLIVSVVKTTPQTFCDTIFVGQTKIFCIDTMELFGIYDDESFQEVCPDVRTGNADFFLEPLNICVYYEGISPGMDSACIIVCDTFGFCDTTYFCLFVKPYFDPPVLDDDIDSTEKATPVVIDFLANDTIFGGIEDIYILDSTISGQVILNLDYSLTYIPDEPYCARWDSLTYVACNPNGCDTASVSIYIECIELTIFSAVSPNNDGVNDLFYIGKIEDCPDNRLWVYNRWGNLVFETRAYKNTWPGSWGSDTDLPDGTYYYILEWIDNGITTVQRGYIELFR